MADRTAVPSAFQTQQRPTDPQLRYLRGLWAEKRVDLLTKEQFDWLDAQFNKPEAEQFVGVTVKRASDIIDGLKKLPVRDNVVRQQNPGLPDVPAGRYAVNNDDGELRFYRVWIGKTGYKKLYVLHGPDSTELPYKAALGVLGKIMREGVRECAIRFGMEIGACSNCGRRLTNRISRELGIGPICGGRMFGDDFSKMASEKRASIILRGDDPDEELE